MKKKIRRIVGAALVGAVCFGFGTALTLSNNVKVDAATTDFGMKTGAAVRLATDSAGLRFIAEMDESKYNAVIDSTTGEYKTGMSLGMVIVPTAYVENAPNGTTEWLEYIGNKKKVVLDIPADKVYEKDGSWCFNGVLTNIAFNSLDIDFIGIAYSYDGAAYDYADFTVAENSRNVAVVASRALNDTNVTYGATNEAILKDFITNSLYREAGVFAYENGETTLYYDSYAAYQADTERTNGSTDIQSVASSLNYSLEYINVQDSVELLANGETTLTVNSAVEGADYSNIIEWSSSNEAVATVENGKVTAVSGGEATITAKLFGQEYKTEVDVVTKYIANATDFANLVTTEDLNGYYALTGNITLTGTFSGLTSGTFSGIFDGRGYTISGGIVSPYLLGATANNATVRNLSIVNLKTVGNPSGTLTNLFKGNSKVENVYINLLKPTDTFTNASGGLMYQNEGVLELNNVLVYLPDKYYADASATGVLASSNSGVIKATNSHFASNASVTIMPNGTAEGVAGYNTLAEMQAAAADGAINLSSFKGFSEYVEMRKFLNVFKAYDLGKLSNAMRLDSAEAYTFTVAQTLEADDIASLQIGSTMVTDYTFANGTFTIPASNYAKFVGGENVDVVISTLSGDTYEAKLDVITKVLMTADFTTVSTDLTGYYVLGENITLTGTFNGLTSGTFSGILDGRGYTISGGKVSYGILGKNTMNATVKNLAINGVGVAVSPDNANLSIAGLLAHTMDGTTNLENLFLTMNNPDNWASAVGVWAYCVKGTFNATNVVSYVQTDRANMSSLVSWVSGATLNLTNAYCGSAVDMKLIVTGAPATINATQYKTLTAMQAAYADGSINVDWAKNLGFYNALVAFLTAA